MLANEQQLAKRAAKRDRRAFAELYDDYVDKIYRYIYYRCGRTDEAEDLTAQVFLQAWEAIGKYRYEGNPFSSWLYRIAHNQMIDYCRVHRETLPLDTPLEGRNDAFDEAERGFDLNQVPTALEQLRWDQQEVIILRFVEGYSTAEVAAMMGKCPDAIRTLQDRALRALQRHLAQAGRASLNSPAGIRASPDA